MSRAKPHYQAKVESSGSSLSYNAIKQVQTTVRSEAGHSASNMVGPRREFAVHSGLLKSRHVLQLDFEAWVFRVIKEGSGSQEIPFDSYVHIDKHTKDPPDVTITAECYINPDNREIPLTSVPKIVRNTWRFENPYEKDEFCKLLRCATIVGPHTWEMFRMLASTSGMVHPRDFPEIIKNLIASEVAGEKVLWLDFCDFLLLLDLIFTKFNRNSQGVPKHVCRAFDHDFLTLLPGENVVSRMTLAHRYPPHSSLLALGPTHGVFVFTNYRLAFQPYHSSVRDLLSFDVPLPLVDEVIRYRSFSGAGMASGVSLKVICHDGRGVVVGFDAAERWLDQLLDTVNHTIFNFRQDNTKAFAFLAPIPPSIVDYDRGWTLYNVKREFKRLKLTSKPFHLVNAQRYTTLAYGPWLCLPDVVDEAQVAGYLEAREMGRVPCVVWRHPRSGATLSRAGSPLSSGLLSTKKIETDEVLVSVLQKLNSDNNELLYIAAMGKRAERPVKNWRFILNNQENLSALRTSFNKINQLCADVSRSYRSSMAGEGSGNHTAYSNIASPATLQATPLPPTQIKKAVPTAFVQNRRRKVSELVAAGDVHTLTMLSPFYNFQDDMLEETWWTALDQSKWLSQVRMLMKDAVTVGSLLHAESASVLLHCNSGVDRTSQVSSLAQVLLDPFYRTMTGFVFLIEKEWLTMGHPFSARCGLSYVRTGVRVCDSPEFAPVFALFMDAVWQLQHQFPMAFQFNQNFLIDIMDSLVSCRFGTFLFNNNQERFNAGANTKTLSAWSFILSPTQRETYANPYYSPPNSVGDVNAPAPSLLSISPNPTTTGSISSAGSTGSAGISSAVSVKSVEPEHGDLWSVHPLSEIATVGHCDKLVPDLSARRILFWEQYYMRWEKKLSQTPQDQLTEAYAKLLTSTNPAAVAAATAALQGRSTQSGQSSALVSPAMSPPVSDGPLALAQPKPIGIPVSSPEVPPVPSRKNSSKKIGRKVSKGNEKKPATVETLMSTSPVDSDLIPSPADSPRADGTQIDEVGAQLQALENSKAKQTQSSSRKNTADNPAHHFSPSRENTYLTQDQFSGPKSYPKVIPVEEEMVEGLEIPLDSVGVDLEEQLERHHQAQLAQLAAQSAAQAAQVAAQAAKPSMDEEDEVEVADRERREQREREEREEKAVEERLRLLRLQREEEDHEREQREREEKEQERKRKEGERRAKEEEKRRQEEELRQIENERKEVEADRKRKDTKQKTKEKDKEKEKEKDRTRTEKEVEYDNRLKLIEQQMKDEAERRETERKEKEQREEEDRRKEAERKAREQEETERRALEEKRLADLKEKAAKVQEVDKPKDSTKDKEKEVKQSLDWHRFRVKIPSWQNVNKENKQDQHVVYDIRVREYFEATSYLEWSVTRRYSDFKKLHTQLTAQFKRVPLPALPSTRFMPSQTKEFLSQRRKALEVFLQKLVASSLFQVEQLHVFLDMMNPQRTITQGNTVEGEEDDWDEDPQEGERDNRPSMGFASRSVSMAGTAPQDIDDM